MRRRRRQSDNKNQPNQEGTWAISYGDMITLLLGFFVLFYSIDPYNNGKGELNKSLIETMKELDTALIIDMDNNAGEKKDIDDLIKNMPTEKIYETRGAKEENNLESYLVGLFDSLWTVFFGETTTPFEKAKLPSSKDSKGENKLTETKLSAKDLGREANIRTKGFSIAKDKKLEKNIPDGGIRENIVELKALDAEAEQIDDKIIIKFPNLSFFDTASTELTKEGIKAIEKFAKVYVPFAGKTKLNIIGFADSRPVKSGRRFKDNLELSVLRAVSVQRDLRRMGVPFSGMRLAGYGVKTKLLDVEKPDSKSGRLALSRKVVLVIEPAGE